MSRNPGANPPNPGVPPKRPAARPAGAPPAPVARPVPGAGLPPVARPPQSPAARPPQSPAARPPQSPAARAPQLAPAPSFLEKAKKKSEEAQKNHGAETTDIIARGSNDYRVRRYLMVILLVGMGAWFAYDGFVGWPSENAKIKDLNAKLEKYNHEGNKDEVAKLNRDPLALKPIHSGKDLFFQKLLAVVLPILGGATLVWALYNSRGEYRLSGNVLSVPGHESVPLNSIVTIDRENWDRKGIAYIEYRLPSGDTDAFALDDFIYEREPTDKIFEIAENFVGKGLGATDEPGDPG